MKSIDFNREWSFLKKGIDKDSLSEISENEWENVILPHSWNADDMVPGGMEAYVGRAWYRKKLVTPELEPEERILLEFEAIAGSSKVWVDDIYVGGKDGGFLGYWMDITEALPEGKEHIISVFADTSFNPVVPPPAETDWENYGGIYRNSTLHIKNHVYVAYKGVRVFTPSVSEKKATIKVDVKVFEARIGGCECIIRSTLYDKEGNIAASQESKLLTLYQRTVNSEIWLPEIKNPRLWSVDNPVLYTLKVELLEDDRVVDAVTDRIGFRYFNFDKDKGFSLNGKSLKLKGCNIHQDYPGLGPATPERFHYEEMRLMKQMGCNYMRGSHYPRNIKCLEACDELGILVMEEQPYWHGSVRAAGGEQVVYNAARMVKDMVEQHGNHPSIFMWNIANELLWSPHMDRGEIHPLPTDERRLKMLVPKNENHFIKRVVGAMYDAFKEADPYRPVSYVVGGRWQQNDEEHITSAVDIVAYNGGAINYRAKPIIDEKTGKAYHFLPDYYRMRFPERIHLLSEGVINDNPASRADWDKELEQWKTQARYWNDFYAREWFCGGSMWCFTDYHANGVYRTKGAMDVYRLPMEIYHFYRAMWTEKPFIHILGHWNWEQGSRRTVTVFTNCDKVELFLNGINLGNGISASGQWPHLPNTPLVWYDVTFSQGCLKAVGISGEAEVCDIRNTEGEAFSILLEASPEKIAADGRDISYITATVVDKDGNRCFTSHLELELQSDGCIKVTGKDKIIAKGGIAKFAVRSKGEVGFGCISVKASEIKGGSIVIYAE